MIDSYKVRRSRLYYIRDKVGKDAKFASIATAEEKGIDLLELAIAEAKAIHASAAHVIEKIAEKPASEASEAETNPEETADVVESHESQGALTDTSNNDLTKSE